jgi:porin
MRSLAPRGSRSRANRWLLLALAVAVLGLMHAERVEAAESSWVEAWMAQPGATGTWFGLRERLDRLGVTPTIAYTTDLMGNPIGGRRQGVAYAAQLYVDVFVDLGKLAGLKGLALDISGNWASGTDLSTDDIDNFFIVSQAFAGDRLRLYTLYLDQALLDGKLDIKVGRFAPGDDFLSWPQYSFLVNIALNPAVFATQVNVPGFTASPIGTWGARIRAKPVESFSATAGIYYSDPSRNLLNTTGLDLGIDITGTGYLGIAEFAYYNNQEASAAGLPGTYRFGGYYDSNRFATFADPLTKRRGNWGLFVLVDQVVYREGPPGSGQGLGLAGTFVAAPDQSINTIPYFAAVGAVYRGLFPRRDKDALAFAVYYGAFSRDLPGQKSETVLELTYSLVLAPWLSIQPDIQYVINPNGRTNVKNALVIGAQISVTF